MLDHSVLENNAHTTIKAHKQGIKIRFVSDSHSLVLTQILCFIFEVLHSPTCIEAKPWGTSLTLRFSFHKKRGGKNSFKLNRNGVGITEHPSVVVEFPLPENQIPSSGDNSECLQAQRLIGPTCPSLFSVNHSRYFPKLSLFYVEGVIVNKGRRVQLRIPDQETYTLYESPKNF